ncbi:hypothetical protein MMC13_006490 [Lambiella insularis]|nr:hypothetical protein [Lambiella insularis]
MPPPSLPTITSTLPPPPISLLLINPNSTPSMTAACLHSLSATLPPGVTITGFTAPHPSPSAIEGALDGVLSAAACLRALAPLPPFDGYLVACFSAHPLIGALREEVAGPVVGIMEASLYAARLLGGRLSVVATGARAVAMQEEAVRGYGLGGWSVGAEGTGLGVLELETRGREEVEGRMCGAAQRLVDRGADVVCLGCAGMVGMRERVEGVVGPGGVRVVDGVGVGVQFLVGLVREGLVTAKKGVYSSAGEGRRARGQEWL